MNQIPFAFSWVYLSFISIPTIQSFNFSPSLIITPPGTTLLGSNENISVPNAKHVEIGSLNDVQKIVQDEFTQHDLVLSFTKHDDYLRRFSVDVGKDNVGTTIYGFGETIRDLEKSLDSDFLYDSCRRYLLPYRLAIQSIIHSTTEKHIAVITDNSYCSVSFLSSLRRNLSEDEHGEIEVYGLIVDVNFQNITLVKEQLYKFRVSDTHVYLLLVPTVYHQIIFTYARFYGLLEGYNVWIVPDLNEQETSIIPEKVMRFTLLANYEEKYKISRVTSNVMNVYDEIAEDNSTARNDYVIKSKAYRSVFETFLQDSVEEEKIFEMVVQYRNEKKYVKGWVSVHAQMDNHVFQLFGNQIDILQTIGHSQEFLTKDKLKIVTIEDEPYVFYNDKMYDKERLTCNEGVVCTQTSLHNHSQTCCVGFIIDVFMLVLKRLNMNYEIYIIEDGKYGAFKNGSWNGMMQDIVSGKADIAIAPLTISQDRLKYIDFTVPFKFDTLGVITRPEAVEHGFINWEFMSPLKADLQVFILTFFLVAIVLNYLLENNIYIAGLMRKGYNYRHEKYYPFVESMTHISGVTLQRDLGGVNPIRPGAMVSSVIYAFGMVIVVTTYTAVLAALLMQHQENEPFKGSQDYRFRNPTEDFTFGHLKDTSLETFFKNSESDVLRRMSIFMEKYNYDGTIPGPELVRRGELDACFGDYSHLYYYLSKDRTCQLKLVKDELLSFGLGFGVRKGLPVTSLLNHVIQYLVDEDEITGLERKFFSNICQPQFFVVTKIELTITRFGGLILLLILTIFIALAMLYPENLWYKYFHKDFLKVLKRTLTGKRKYQGK